MGVWKFRSPHEGWDAVLSSGAIHSLRHELSGANSICYFGIVTSSSFRVLGVQIKAGANSFTEKS